MCETSSLAITNEWRFSRAFSSHFIPGGCNLKRAIIKTKTTTIICQSACDSFEQQRYCLASTMKFINEEKKKTVHLLEGICKYKLC